MSDYKLFSVIIPVYNRETLLKKTLQSVLDQTHPNIEVIIVDDGSTDNSAGVAEAWKEEHSGPGLSVKILKKANGGVSSARNMGIEHATGEYIQFLDSDDTVSPDRLEVLASTFEETGADYIQTGFDGFDPESGEVVQTVYGREGQNQVELAYKGYLFANTLRASFKTDLVKRIDRWNTEMSCFEDRAYVEHAVMHANKPIAIRPILARAMRGGSDRLSDKLRSYEGRAFRIYCESKLAQYAKERKDIPEQILSEFASRIYGLSLRSNAMGWKDHGDRCRDIADAVDAPLNKKGRVRRMVSRLGKYGARFYLWMGAIKKK